MGFDVVHLNLHKTFSTPHKGEDFRQVFEDAVLNTNYLLKRVRENFDLPFDRWCKYEFIITGKHRWRRRTLRSIKCLHEKAELL